MVAKPVQTERSGVGMRVELDHAEPSLGMHVGDAQDVGQGDAVVAADDDRDRARRGDVTNEGAHVVVAAHRVPDDDLGVPVVSHLQVLEEVDPGVEMWAAVRRRPEVVASAYRLGTEVRPGAGRVRSVPGDAADRDIDPPRLEIGAGQAERQLHERLDAGVRRLPLVA